jgi:hypothetical protein
VEDRRSLNQFIVGRSSWKNPAEPLYPWVETISRILSTQELPDLDGSLLYVLSDYGGSHKESRYLTTSILIASLEDSQEWEFRRTWVRKSYLADGRRMSFKGLNDRQRRMALVPFLEAADLIRGVCVTFVVHKSINLLCIPKGKGKETKISLGLGAPWGEIALERAIRLVHFVSLLIGGFSQPNQDVYWISDEDELFASSIFSKDIAKLASGFTSHYARHELGELGVGTTTIDEGDRVEEDLAAVPDLAAGAVAEIATNIARVSRGYLPDGVALEVPRTSEKTQVLTSWLADEKQRLKRPIISFDRAAEGGFRVAKFGLS